MLSQIHLNFPASGSDGMSAWASASGFIVVFALLEFAFLHRVLTRGDFDTLNKILWVIVIIGAPFLGFVLYLIAAPSVTPQGVSPRARQARHGDDLSGTPWADDPGYTKPS